MISSSMQKFCRPTVPIYCHQRRQLLDSRPPCRNTSSRASRPNPVPAGPPAADNPQLNNSNAGIRSHHATPMACHMPPLCFMKKTEEVTFSNSSVTYFGADLGVVQTYSSSHGPQPFWFAEIKASPLTGHGSRSARW